jgi:hypothetical protein
MPERLVDRYICIAFLFVMAKRAPPLLYDLDQIENIGKQGNRKWAIKLAVEDPKELRFGYPSEGPVSIEQLVGKNLILQGIPVTDPAGNKILPIRLELVSPHQGQVSPH